MIIIIIFDKIKQYKNITSHKNLQYCVAQNRLQLSRWSRSHQSHPSSTNSGMIFPSSESTPRSVRTSEDLSRSLQPIIPLLHHERGRSATLSFRFLIPSFALNQFIFIYMYMHKGQTQERAIAKLKPYLLQPTFFYFFYFKEVPLEPLYPTILYSVNVANLYIYI